MSASGIYASICLSILRGQVSLPSPGGVAQRIRQLMRSPNCHAETLARLLLTNPAAAAYLVRVANSPIYRTREPAGSVRAALSRLGFARTLEIVTVIELRNLFDTKSPHTRALLREIWRQSTKLAATSAVLARLCRCFDPEKALLAGLLQDIGALPILYQLDRRCTSQLDLADFKQVMREFAPRVGALLLEKWGFDSDIQEVAHSREDWLRDPGPTADLADIVLLARLHTYVGTLEVHRCPRINELPAFFKLPLGELTPELSLHVLKQAAGEITEVEVALGH